MTEKEDKILKVLERIADSLSEIKNDTSYIASSLSVTEELAECIRDNTIQVSGGIQVMNI